LEKPGNEIESRNQMIFHSGVANRAFSVNRTIGSRRFDEIGWKLDAFELCAAVELQAQHPNL
jgi:hypothetical protein